MSNLNPKIKFNKKENININEIYSGLLQGNRFSLGKAITLIESVKPIHKEMTKKLISKCLKIQKDTLRIGITGAPGVGKSSMLEKLGLHIIEKGFKPAVLAIDPSSSISGGSILGDKTRMPELSMSENAFIRPSPAGKNLGGVAKKTNESIIAAECAGFNPIFVETVGVGQSETEVHSMTDLFILLIQPDAGDDIQGIKRGIMEMADIIVVNKADGKNMINAEKTFDQYSGIISLLPEKENGWETKITMISAMTGSGIEELWQIITEYENNTKSSGYYHKKRKKQNLSLFNYYLFNNLIEIFNTDPKLNSFYMEMKKKVETGLISYYDAGDFLLKLLIK